MNEIAYGEFWRGQILIPLFERFLNKGKMASAVSVPLIYAKHASWCWYRPFELVLFALWNTEAYLRRSFQMTSGAENEYREEFLFYTWFMCVGKDNNVFFATYALSWVLHWVDHEIGQISKLQFTGVTTSDNLKESLRAEIKLPAISLFVRRTLLSSIFFFVGRKGHCQPRNVLEVL